MGGVELTTWLDISGSALGQIHAAYGPPNPKRDGTTTERANKMPDFCHNNMPNTERRGVSACKAKINETWTRSRDHERA